MHRAPPPSRVVSQWRVGVARIPTAARQLRLADRIPWARWGAIDFAGDDTAAAGGRRRSHRLHIGAKLRAESVT
jgi:hypothetical protein